MACQTNTANIIKFQNDYFTDFSEQLELKSLACTVHSETNDRYRYIIYNFIWL